ncbi:MAG: methyltransferase domain-containing protein [Deltaproteobacteria bacterium]|nr:MAG: methyltransferase domain-containing protein [Deltaproteobacteria bacterium]
MSSNSKPHDYLQDVQKLFTEKTSLYHLVFLDIFRYHKGLKMFLRKSNCLQPGMKVLDAGCGSGNLTRNLYEIASEKGLDGISFHGFDITQAMLDLFKKWISGKKAENVELSRANVLQPGQLPVEWKDYDLVVSAAMLEYLPKDEIKDALRNLRILLKDNGKIIVFITRDNILMKLLIQIWWKANMYKRSEMMEIFKDAGFGRIRFKRFPFPYSYLSLWGLIIEAEKG